MSRVYLVRHAIAEERERWTAPDSERSLTAAGNEQATRLAEQFGGEGIGSVLSSPSVRCVQTVQPLATRLGLPVTRAPVLAEGSEPGAALRFLAGAEAKALAACTHGDVIQGVLWLLARDGVLGERDIKLKKASTWLMRIDNGRVRSARYLPPP